MGEVDGMGCFRSGVYRNRYRIYESFYDTIYSDTMYPNDLRPKENHGYRTKHRG